MCPPNGRTWEVMVADQQDASSNVRLISIVAIAEIEMVPRTHSHNLTSAHQRKKTGVETSKM